MSTNSMSLSNMGVRNQTEPLRMERITSAKRNFFEHFKLMLLLREQEGIPGKAITLIAFKAFELIELKSDNGFKQIVKEYLSLAAIGMTVNGRLSVKSHNGMDSLVWHGTDLSMDENDSNAEDSC